MANKKNMHIVLAMLSMIGCFAFAEPAAAQATDDATLLIKAQVLGTCSVNGGTLDFGVYTGEQKEASTDITYNCEAENIEIGLSFGSNFGTTRNMKNPDGDFIPYFLYKEGLDGEEWGPNTGTEGSFTKKGVDPSVNGVGSTQVLGMIPDAPDGSPPAPGVYSDIVIVTLTAN